MTAATSIFVILGWQCGTELDSLCPRNDHLVPRSIGLGISVGQILLIIQWLLFWADIDFAFIFLQAPLQGILL